MPLFVDFAPQIETDSIWVEGVRVLELDYQFNWANYRNLLAKFTGKTIYIKSAKQLEKQAYRLLSISDGLLVVANLVTGEIHMNPEGEIILNKLPKDITLEPCLQMKILPVETDTLQVSYLTKGLSCEPNYVLHLGSGKKASLMGWLHLKNESGMSFERAKIQWIAGDVRRVTQYHRASFGSAPRNQNVSVMGDFSADIEPEAFSDYQLYPLSESTTLPANQSKQIPFLSFENVQYRRYYELNNSRPQVQTHIEFLNHEDDGLGAPLPRGNIKVYESDASHKSLFFVGEDHLMKTACNQKVDLTIGEAFDITTKTELLKRSEKAGYEYVTMRLIVDNQKKEDITANYTYYLPDDSCNVLESSDDYEPIKNGCMIYWLCVSAKQTKQVDFTYRMKKNKADA